MNVLIAELPGCCGTPTKAHNDDSGYDVYAALPGTIQIPSGAIAKIPLGFKMAIDPGYEAQMRPRSSMAGKGITMPNAPGTIDAGYRGEVCVLLCNLTPAEFTIEPGMKIAQMVIQAIPDTVITFVLEEDLPDSSRGTAGFGSTGVY